MSSGLRAAGLDIPRPGAAYPRIPYRWVRAYTFRGIAVRVSRLGGVHGLNVGALYEYGRKRILAKTFRMHTTLDRLSLLSRARRVAGENGATLIGDERSGRFSHGMVGGEYRMVGETVFVTITEKHPLIPWPLVESRLRALVR